MKLINQTKNLKLILITPNGEIIVHYDKDFCDESGKPYDLHYQVLYETIKKDLKSYKKLVKKAEKLQGQNMDLIHLMLDFDFCLFYDTTNYQNYRPYKDHSGLLMLPKEPSRLLDQQQVSLLRLMKEMKMNLDHMRYDESNHLDCITYQLLEVTYRNKKKKFISIGNMNDLASTLLGEEVMEMEEVRQDPTPHRR